MYNETYQIKKLIGKINNLLMKKNSLNTYSTHKNIYSDWVSKGNSNDPDTQRSRKLG